MRFSPHFSDLFQVRRCMVMKTPSGGSPHHPVWSCLMPHDTPLISTLVAGFVLAFVLGAAANRLRLPTLVGYLIAGVLVGPHTPGFVADTNLAPQLAEIGVILLMFGVGLHFSLARSAQCARRRRSRRPAADDRGDAMGWALAAALGMADWRRPGLRPRFVGCIHGRSAEGAAGAAPGGDGARQAGRRLADRRRPGDGAGSGDHSGGRNACSPARTAQPPFEQLAGAAARHRIRLFRRSSPTRCSRSRFSSP